MKVRDLIAMEIDIDCYDNVVEGIGIAFCGPVKLTEDGEKEFADVMDYECEILQDPFIGYDVCIIITDDHPYIGHNEKLKRANKFFKSVAGYCTEAESNKWFIYE